MIFLMSNLESGCLKLNHVFINFKLIHCVLEYCVAIVKYLESSYVIILDG